MTTKELIDKIISDYKEHYDFPWQGESHMRDCLASALADQPQESAPTETDYDKFIERWDSDEEFPDNNIREDSPMFFAWWGWQAARKLYKEPLEIHVTVNAEAITEIITVFEAAVCHVTDVEALIKIKRAAMVCRDNLVAVDTNKSPWTPVTERLPNDGTRVIVFAKEYPIQIAGRNGTYWWCDSGRTKMSPVNTQELIQTITTSIFELNFTIVAKVRPYRVDFEIYDIAARDADDNPMWPRIGSASNVDCVSVIDEAEVYISGEVKWDGCSNWSFDEQDRCMLHGCSKRDIQRYGDVLALCWDITAKLCPKWNGCEP